MVSLRAPHETAQAMRANTGISERQACALMGGLRGALRKKGRGERDCGVLSRRILFFAAQRRGLRYGEAIRRSGATNAVPSAVPALFDEGSARSPRHGVPTKARAVRPSCSTDKPPPSSPPPAVRDKQ